jgi:hypothetical protein
MAEQQWRVCQEGQASQVKSISTEPPHVRRDNRATPTAIPKTHAQPPLKASQERLQPCTRCETSRLMSARIPSLGRHRRRFGCLRGQGKRASWPICFIPPWAPKRLHGIASWDPPIVPSGSFLYRLPRVRLDRAPRQRHQWFGPDCPHRSYGRRGRFAANFFIGDNVFDF